MKMEHFDIVDGIRVRYRTEGQGPQVLLIHDFLLSQRSWSRLLPGLASRFTVHALDLPGFGGSERPRSYGYTVDAFAHTVASLMDRIGLSTALLFGHSLGGGVALSIAASYPERIRRVLVAAATIYPLRLPPEARLALAPLVGARLFRSMSTRAWLGRYLRRHVYRAAESLPQDDLDAYWQSLRQPGGREAARRTLQTLAYLESVESVPPRVHCPVLALWGAEDQLVPPRDGQRLVDALREGRLELIAGAGHSPIVEAPERVLELAVEFLEE